MIACAPTPAPKYRGAGFRNDFATNPADSRRCDGTKAGALRVFRQDDAQTRGGARRDDGVKNATPKGHIAFPLIGGIDLAAIAIPSNTLEIRHAGPADAVGIKLQTCRDT